ncbi:MAG: DUF11 domain-containing protein, partial [Tannerella sp.]|nr:DUF11 domain-containing protein [Tannerella sp.]
MNFNVRLLILFILSGCYSLINAQNNLIPETENCSSTRPAFAFNIMKKWSSSTGNRIFTDCTPIVGDIDGDGLAEVLACGGYGLAADTIYVFEGETGVTIGKIREPQIAWWAWTGTSFLIYRDKTTGKGRVFISAENGYIHLYEVSSAPGVRPITFTKLWQKSGFNGHNSPIISDLDGDGNPEFVVGNMIFDCDGNLKATLAYKGQLASWDYVYLPIAGDVDGDGLPEVIVGANVYKYDGTNAILYATCPGINSGDPGEGVNMIADIDQDGNVDVVFHRLGTNYSSGDGFVKVWTPATGADLGTLMSNLSGQRSVPFIADIDGIIGVDGKKHPEICINTVGRLYSFTYNGASFSQKWTLSHSDLSGATILTMFDFNNDDIFELVYRDEDSLRIFNGSGSVPVVAYRAFAGSETATESPVIADVTGDGSANIIVTRANTITGAYGEIDVFEGAESKWASCPHIWNQQFYSNLTINRDLTIPDTIKSVNLTFTRPDNSTVQYYNGGSMQAPYISAETFLPIDVSPDVYVVEGNMKILSPTSVRLEVTFGNQGLALVSPSTPIQYYKDEISPLNIIDSKILGIRLGSGGQYTIVDTITNLPNPLPSRFYVRILDDGTNFPALGAYSDCNLTNNHKSFGTLELLKTVNANSACVDGTSIFNVRLINNTDQTLQPQTFDDIVLCDSIGSGWEFLDDTVSTGTLTTYNPTTHKIFWTIDSILPGDTAIMRLTAKAKTAGAIRNSAWIESVDGTILGKELIWAYVIVNSTQAPDSAVISAQPPSVCGNVVLLNSMPGKSSY